MAEINGREAELKRIADLNGGVLSVEYEEGFGDGWDLCEQAVGACSECRHADRWCIGENLFTCTKIGKTHRGDWYCADFERRGE